MELVCLPGYSDIISYLVHEIVYYGPAVSWLVKATYYLVVVSNNDEQFSMEGVWMIGNDSMNVDAYAYWHIGSLKLWW